MITLKGKYNEARVYAKTVEMRCEDKIRQYLDHPISEGAAVRVMPDVHLGKSAVIGFTATFHSAVIPSIIGTDIGCGVCAVNFGRGALRFDKLDSFIRKNIPCGMDVRASLHEKLDQAIAFLNEKGEKLETGRFKSAIRKLSEKQNHSPERIFASLGTLGGGNHFIEVDLDEEQNRWLIIHTGSRILGARTAEYFEIAALRETPAESPLKYLSGASLEEYCADTSFVQFYAKVNRALIAMTIADFFKFSFTEGEKSEAEYIESVHNYLDFDRRVIRKGAISAGADERLIIPFSMSEGSLIGRGKGNSEWNASAPHGAGRKIPRSQARSGLSLDEYRKQMRSVWSSTVCKETLDESPMAYKKPKDILAFLNETVNVEKRLASVYNFKTVE
jgi:RNA-splicing ligase RtcB